MGKEEEVYKCEKGISLDECELAILRIAVDKAEEKEEPKDDQEKEEGKEEDKKE